MTLKQNGGQRLLVLDCQIRTEIQQLSKEAQMAQEKAPHSRRRRSDTEIVRKLCRRNFSFSFSSADLPLAQRLLKSTQKRQNSNQLTGMSCFRVNSHSARSDGP